MPVQGEEAMTKHRTTRPEQVDRENDARDQPPGHQGNHRPNEDRDRSSRSRFGKNEPDRRSQDDRKTQERNLDNNVDR